MFAFLGLLPTGLFSERTEGIIAKTFLAQDHSAPVEVDIGLSGNPETSWSRLSLRKYPPRHVLDFFDWVSQKQSTVIEAKEKKSGIQPLVETTKQEVLESSSKARMDKFGTAMRSRYAIFRKTIQESLDAESSDGNHSWPGDATSNDSWRFCIA